VGKDELGARNNHCVRFQTANGTNFTSEEVVMKPHPASTAFLICLLSLIAVITAFAFRKQQDPQLRNLTDGELKAVVIQFERTGCYGNCPAYKLTIYGDGRAEYEGKKNVKQTGRKEERIEAADVKRVVSEFDKAGFFTIDQFTEKNCSCSFCTDMPTAITEIQVKGTSHRVEHYYGCRCAPKALWELEQAIDKMAHTEQWTGDVSKQGPFGTTCFNK
jgi:hypothetical protein